MGLFLRQAFYTISLMKDLLHLFGIHILNLLSFNLNSTLTTLTRHTLNGSFHPAGFTYITLLPPQRRREAHQQHLFSIGPDEIILTEISVLHLLFLDMDFETKKIK